MAVSVMVLSRCKWGGGTSINGVILQMLFMPKLEACRQDWQHFQPNCNWQLVYALCVFST